MIYIGADVLVTLDGLVDNSGNYVNSATVSGKLLDITRTTEITTFTMSYVSSSNGDYQGTIPKATTTDLTEGTTYIVRCTAVYSGNTVPIDHEDVAGYYVT